MKVSVIFKFPRKQTNKQQQQQKQYKFTETLKEHLKIKALFIHLSIGTNKQNNNNKVVKKTPLIEPLTSEHCWLWIKYLIPELKLTDQVWYHTGTV